MKTLRKRVRKRVMARWLAYLALAYLLASLGVNAAINPLQDLRGIMAQIKEPKIEKRQEGMVIYFLDGKGEKSGDFLSFQMKEAKDYSIELRLLVYPLHEAAQEAIVEVWKGWNSVDIGGLLPQGRVCEKIIIPQDIIESEGIVLKNAVISPYRKTDIGRMMYVFASFLFLAAFWECVCWVKERYAD